MVIKVFTPIKRVPTMIGKAQGGQKLPFGPYTLPQIGAFAVLLAATSVCTMNFPVNPAGTFIIGTLVTIGIVFVLGLVPYTGVRLISRSLWLARLIIVRKPASASGVPIDAESARQTLFIEESTVLILPDPVADSHAERAETRVLQEVLGMGSGAGPSSRVTGNGNRQEGRG